METEQNSEQQVPSQKVMTDGYADIPKVFHYKVAGKRYGRLNYINAYMIITGVFFVPFMVSYILGLYGLDGGGMILAGLGGFMYLCFAVASTFFHVRAIVLRLHDLNLSGLLMIPIIFVPALLLLVAIGLIYAYGMLDNEAALVIGTIIYGFIALLILVLWVLIFAVPGTKGVNKFGLQPKQGSFGGLIVMLSLIVLSILISIIVMIATIFFAGVGYY